ncbi:MAG TPA: hypothetical protein VFH46_04350, partial [Pyrinomonadaceae bacterium]|nr:hypothetical protein [Pyrinomonadaceae bacterium]
DVERASEHYHKQLKFIQEMAASDPMNAQFRRNEAVALINVGDIEARSGKAAKSLEHYTEALRIREQLASAAKEDTTIARELAEIEAKLQATKEHITHK